ncbi:MAG TPA: rhomboid family intramembrane serine protease [Flavobacteriaceae bacterium]|nr:rhomboid family intramembrane serine protease [Flavobacteriaceae bacterium]
MLASVKKIYNEANIAEKIIYINALLFLITVLLSTFIINWFALPTSLNEFITKPWTILSYGFIHQRFFHLLSNLLVLYYIGNLFLTFYSKKTFINFYFLGILIGGIGFLINYYITGKNGMPLGGASAGVTAIFVAIATKIPRYALRLRFIGSVELWVLAAIWVLLSVLQITLPDNGPAIAHLSGAIFGFIYVKQLEKGNDIGKWFENILNYFATWFTPQPKQPFKKVYKTKKKKSTNTEVPKQKKINEILDKISKSGYESLTKEEKDFLFRAGKK